MHSCALPRSSAIFSSSVSRLETGLCGISCSDPGYPARTLDIPLWSGISRFWDIPLPSEISRFRDIPLGTRISRWRDQRDIPLPSGISRVRAGYPALSRSRDIERDISLRAGYLVPHRDIYRFGISRFWAGYLRIEISRSTSGYPAKSGLQTL